MVTLEFFALYWEIKACITSGFSQSPHMLKVTGPETTGEPPPGRYCPIKGKSCNVQAVNKKEREISKAKVGSLYFIILNCTAMQVPQSNKLVKAFGVQLLSNDQKSLEKGLS